MTRFSTIAVWTTGLWMLIGAGGSMLVQNAPAQDGQPADAKKNEAKNKPIHVLVPQLWDIPANGPLVKPANDDQAAIVKRLEKLKFKVSVEHWSKVDPDRLELIDVILLPSCWASQAAQYNHFESKKQGFHDFVRRGGGLIVCQPNPNHLPNQECTPTLLPWPITFRNGYDTKDPTRLNLDPNHFITDDLPGKDLPFPFDTMIKVDPQYKVLAKQKSTGSASLAVCPFGKGRVVVQTANESPAADIPFGDEILQRMVVWAAQAEKK